MNNRPILLDYACLRRDSDIAAFFYDREQDMNLIHTPNGIRTFINVGTGTAPAQELLTKTEAARESDDDILSTTGMIGIGVQELLTKTSARRESDDEEWSHAELVTKSFADRESDDEDFEKIFDMLN